MKKKLAYEAPNTTRIVIETEGFFCGSIELKDEEYDPSNGRQFAKRKNPIWSNSLLEDDDE